VRDIVPIVAEDIAEDEADALLAKIADGIVSRRLAVPAVLFLETCKPLNFVGSQLMMAFHPFVASFVKGDDYRKVALLMERDANVEELLLRIERLEAGSSPGANAGKLGPDAGGSPKRGNVAKLWARVRGKSNESGATGDE
jgi:hypothetical protein